MKRIVKNKLKELKRNRKKLGIKLQIAAQRDYYEEAQIALELNTIRVKIKLLQNLLSENKKRNQYE